MTIPDTITIAAISGVILNLTLGCYLLRAIQDYHQKQAAADRYLATIKDALGDDSDDVAGDADL